GRREVVELDLAEPIEPPEVLRRLRGAAPPGLDFLDAEAAPPGRPAHAAAAAYRLDVPAQRPDAPRAALAPFLAPDTPPHTRPAPARAQRRARRRPVPARRPGRRGRAARVPPELPPGRLRPPRGAARRPGAPRPPGARGRPGAHRPGAGPLNRVGPRPPRGPA